MQTNPQHEHQTYELRFLFKHLLLFFIGSYVIRFINSIFLSSLAWSSPFVFVWGFFVIVHFFSFLMSVGVFGIEWEGKSSIDIMLELKSTYLDPYINRAESFYNSKLSKK